MHIPDLRRFLYAPGRCALCALALATGTTAAGQDTITTIAGGFLSTDPLHAGIGNPSAVAIAADGTVYWAAGSRIMHRRTDGTLKVVAGTGGPGAFGDGGPATAAGLDAVLSLAFDAHGDLFIGDYLHVREIAAHTGIITTVAGGGTSALDGVPATTAALQYVIGIAVDTAGNLFIADEGSGLVRRVDAATSIITTVAGNGLAPSSVDGDNGPATSASLYYPCAVAVDATGNLYIAESGRPKVRFVAASTGIITTAAGNGTPGITGDGGPATAAEIGYPQAVALSNHGDLYFSTRSTVRTVAAGTGIISSVVGGGFGYNGDGIPASGAQLEYPSGLALDQAGDLFIADGGNARIRRVDAGTQLIATIAGTGAQGYSGDGSTAPLTQFGQLDGIAYGPSGDLYVVDQGDNRICRISATTGIVTTVAGTGVHGFSGDGGPATLADLAGPARIAFDQAGDLLITDQYNNRIRKVLATTGIITTIAGSGTSSLDSPSDGSFTGDGGLASAATLNQPVGLRVLGNGDLLFTDMMNQRVRRITAATGVITTIAGNNPLQSPSGPYTPGGFGGDGGPATAALFNFPVDIVQDQDGNIIVDDNQNRRVRRISASDGTISTIAGTGATTVTTAVGDGGPATAANLNYPTALLLDSQGNLLVSEGGNDAIRRIDHATGVITTIAGSQLTGFSGDGGQATAARLSWPISTCFDPAGDLLIADGNNARVRKVRFNAVGPDPTGPTPPPASGAGGGGHCGLGGATALILLALGFLTVRLRATPHEGAHRNAGFRAP